MIHVHSYDITLKGMYRYLDGSHRLGYRMIWRFPKVGIPQNGWFIRENPINMDDFLGVPPIFGNPHIGYQHQGKEQDQHLHLVNVMWA